MLRNLVVVERKRFRITS